MMGQLKMNDRLPHMAQNGMLLNVGVFNTDPLEKHLNT